MKGIDSEFDQVGLFSKNRSGHFLSPIEQNERENEKVLLLLSSVQGVFYDELKFNLYHDIN